ncbi:MAG: ribosomal L7Ae/L30e/S12e/Gadd45 family protein [Erysipelothrix sp.]
MSDNTTLLNSLGLCKRAGKLVHGDELIPAIQKRNVSVVVVADDASDRTRKQILDKCAFYKITVVTGLQRDELSQAIGTINRVAVGVSDTGLGNLVKKAHTERGGVDSDE